MRRIRPLVNIIGHEGTLAEGVVVVTGDPRADGWIESGFAVLVPEPAAPELEPVPDYPAQALATAEAVAEAAVESVLGEEAAAPVARKKRQR